MSNIRLRIAPSPTGYPHIATAYQALLNYSFAKRNNGKFLIRIEDTDRSRFVEDAEGKIYEAIDWLGLTEDESPRKGGDFAPYRQSERLELYQKFAKQLVDEDKAYYCFCSPQRLAEVRKQMQKDGKPPMYDKHCRNLKPEEVRERIKAGEKYVIRMKVPADQKIIVKDLIRGDIEFDSNGVDDQVLLKSDGFPTYHLAVVVDDHHMEITHMVRGEEWLPSSPKHVLLYQFFDWQMPILVHTPTLRNPDKSKLSKRKGHTSVSYYQEQGFLPEATLNFLGQLGWTHPEGKEIFDLDEFIKLFDFKDLSPAGPVFDEVKFRWLNGKYIREKLSDEDLLSRLKKYLTIEISDEILTKTLPLIKERLEVLSDVNDLLAFLNPDEIINADLVRKQSKGKKSDEEIKTLLSALRSSLENDQKFSVASIEQDIRGLKAKFPEWGGRDYFMTLRVVTTAFPVTPPLFESIEILGRDLVLKRIDSVLAQL